MPELQQRTHILQVLLKGENLTPEAASFPFGDLAKATSGYSGSDLKELCKAAAMIPVNEIMRKEVMAQRAIAQSALEAESARGGGGGGGGGGTSSALPGAALAAAVAASEEYSSTAGTTSADSTATDTAGGSDGAGGRTAPRPLALGDFIAAKRDVPPTGKQAMDYYQQAMAARPTGNGPPPFNPDSLD
jgi:SpoVK/Ycf46/Vps4 family AAA+-type ATPase